MDAIGVEKNNCNLISIYTNESSVDPRFNVTVVTDMGTMSFEGVLARHEGDWCILYEADFGADVVDSDMIYIADDDQLYTDIYGMSQVLIESEMCDARCRIALDALVDAHEYMMRNCIKRAEPINAMKLFRRYCSDL